MTAETAKPIKCPGLTPANGVPEALRATAREVIAEGRAALGDPNRSDAAAVHDFRKAMKRWRAFLRLLQPFLGDEGRRMRLEAAALARSLAGARDARITLDALADLGKAQTTLSIQSVATITARLETLGTHAEGNLVTVERREQIDEVLVAAGESVKFWPLSTLSYREIATELAEGYRRARNALPKGWKNADPETLHDLRKRVVIHRYQMEIIEPLWPRFAQFWVGEVQRLRERLGRHQDLIVLAQLTEPHQPLAHWRSRLVPLIAARRAQHVETAARIAARVFADSPKAFRRRLLALWYEEAEPAAPSADGSALFPFSQNQRPPPA